MRAQHLSTRDGSEGRFGLRNPTLSALISNLGHASNFRSNTARRLSVLFKNEMELIFYPDQPVSLIISARQEIFSVRGGVLATRPRNAREPSPDPCESNLQKRLTTFSSHQSAQHRHT